MLSKIIFNRPALNNRPGNASRRAIRLKNDNNKTIQVGDLHLDYNRAKDNKNLFDKLSADGIIQCREFFNVYNQTRRCMPSASNATFNAQTIYWDENFAHLLYEVAELAQCNGIDFLPKEVMFESLLSKLQQLEKKLDLSEIYKKYDFNSTYKRPLLPISFDQKKALLQSFLALDEDKDHLIMLFNDHIHDQFNMGKTFTYNMLEEIIRQGSDSSEYRGLKSYVLSACIDVMDSYGVNACEEHSPGMIFYYWYNVRLEKFNGHQAVKRFVAEFEPAEEYMDQVYLALTDIISKPILPNHVFLK